jgi:hypothetical protein
MATPESTSRLEALPAELFNRVLSYVYDPEQCEIQESNIKFRGYRLETSLLRVNKAIHELAKSYLHHALSWVRLDINWGAFIIDPRWVGVNYILLNHANLPKSPSRAPLRSSVRSTSQQAPPGRLHVRVDFPPATTPARTEITNHVKDNTHKTMSILVLEKELAGFIMVLQMNDGTYCHRLHPGALLTPDVRAEPGLHGISSEITIAPRLEIKRYKQMLEQVAALRGELHKARIFAHGDSEHAASIVRYIQKEDSDAPRPQIPTAQMTYDLSMAAMSRSVTFLMWLKNRGDDYLKEGLYSSASMCYDTVCSMETFWLKTSPLPAQRTFWTESSTIFGAFGVALVINSVITYMAGDGNGFGAVRVRGTTMQSHHGALLLSSAAGLTLESERFMELNTVAQLYIVQAQDPTDSV